MGFSGVPEVPLLCPHPARGCGRRWTPWGLQLCSCPLFLPPGNPSLQQRLALSARRMGPASLFKSLLLMVASALSPCHPTGRREREAPSFPSGRAIRSGSLGSWFCWASIWIVNPLPPVEGEKQALKTSALIGGVCCLMNYSERSAKHTAFWKRRHFQYGALSPPMPPR